MADNLGYFITYRKQIITAKTVIYFFLVMISLVFGILNFLMPTYYLAAIIILTVAGIVLFLYPFAGLLVYQFIMFIQPGVLFPPLHHLHPERIIAIFLIVSLIINIKLKRGKIIVIEHKLLYLIVFFVLAMVISVPTSYWPGLSKDKMIDFTKMVAYIFLIVNIVKSEKKLKIFLWEYLLLIGYIAISSAIAYKTGNVMEAQGIIRAKGLTDIDPNTLAITLGLSLSFHFMLFRMEKNKFLKGLSLFLVASTLYTMILTGSRGGVIGLATVTLLSWAFLPRKGARLYFLIAATVLMIVSMPSQYQERYASIFSNERDASSDQRIKVWEKGLKMMRDRPITGVGMGAFGVANAEGYSEGRKSYLNAHSLYVQIGAELGMVGVITFALYVANLFIFQKRYRRFIVVKFKNKDWLWGCLAAMTISTITLFVVGVVGHNLYRSNWYFYGSLTVVIGFLLRLRMADIDSREKPLTPDKT